MSLRILYTRFGEILALLLIVTIGVYLHHSFSASDTIINNEAKAREMVEMFYRVEQDVFDKNNGRYQLPSKVLNHAYLLQNLVLISKDEDQALEILTDDSYIYCFKMTHKAVGVKDDLRGVKDRKPTGYRLMAWPRKYSVTGELAFYVDQQGVLAVSKNERCMYEGKKGIPPNWAPPLEAIKKGVEVECWKKEKDLKKP